MNSFHPSQFFDLSEFAHADIFNTCRYVWEVLPLIKNYLQAHNLGSIEVDVPEGVVLVNKELISIGKGTLLEPGAYIKGPCIIGENCQVRQGAYIRGHLICGNECVIGHTSEIKNALFFDHAQAAHFAYVGDSVLGNRTNLGAGTKCANLRFDNRPVSVFHEGRKVDTRLRKFGAIFGDLSQSGCNSVMSPGTLLGKGASVYPCANAHGIIPDGHSYKQDGSLIELSLTQKKGILIDD